jgi:hypothetical protein
VDGATCICFWPKIASPKLLCGKVNCHDVKSTCRHECFIFFEERIAVTSKAFQNLTVEKWLLFWANKHIMNKTFDTRTQQYDLVLYCDIIYYLCFWVLLGSPRLIDSYYSPPPPKLSRMKCVNVFPSSLTPWIRNILEKPRVTHLGKNFSAFYETRRFITFFTGYLSWARCIQSTLCHDTSLRSSLTLFSPLCLGLLSGLFHSVFQPKLCKHFHLSRVNYMSRWSVQVMKLLNI